MTIADKIVRLRKSNGFSQEELAEKLNVSRQAISRWEMGTAMPDALNIKQLSKLFNVTTDYLLNDDYQSDDDLPKLKEVKQNNFKQIMFYFVIIEVMILLIEFMATIILESIFFSILSILLFLAFLGAFEYSYRKDGNEASFAFRRYFYKISAWLGLYFPIRFVMYILTRTLTHIFSGIVFEIVVLVVYILSSTLVCLSLDKQEQ